MLTVLAQKAEEGKKSTNVKKLARHGSGLRACVDAEKPAQFLVLTHMVKDRPLWSRPVKHGKKQSRALGRNRP